MISKLYAGQGGNICVRTSLWFYRLSRYIEMKSKLAVEVIPSNFIVRLDPIWIRPGYNRFIPRPRQITFWGY